MKATSPVLPYFTKWPNLHFRQIHGCKQLPRKRALIFDSKQTGLQQKPKVKAMEASSVVPSKHRRQRHVQFLGVKAKKRVHFRNKTLHTCGVSNASELFLKGAVVATRVTESEPWSGVLLHKTHD